MKLAVIGNGNIVKEAFVALQSVPDINVMAICVRKQSRHKGEMFQKQYQIPLLFTSYEEVLECSEVDTIYIGIINNLHFTYAKKALLAGKNVILEKPSCIKSCEMEELAHIARQNRLFFFEAVTFLHAPFFKEICNYLPAIGKVKMVQCNFSKYSSRYDKYLQKQVHAVFDPALSGGALFDMNIYNLNFAVALFGEPLDTIYLPNLGFNKVDTSGVAILKYSDFIATCTAAKDSTSPGFMIIQGEKGYIHVDGRPDNLKALNICYYHSEVSSIYKSLQSNEHRMVDEFREFNEMLSTGNYLEMEKYLKISIEVCRTAEKCHNVLKA